MTDDDCSVCGGARNRDSATLDQAYLHTEDCRIRRRWEYNRGVRRMKTLLAASSLGTPGAQALIKIGRLSTQGLSDEEIEAALTPSERADAKAETDRLVRELDRSGPR